MVTWPLIFTVRSLSTVVRRRDIGLQSLWLAAQLINLTPLDIFKWFETSKSSIPEIKLFLGQSILNPFLYFTKWAQLYLQVEKLENQDILKIVTVSKNIWFSSIGDMSCIAILLTSCYQHLN